MIRFSSYDIVFQEIPGEVTLAFNLSGCPNRCKGCHSSHLQKDIGDELTESVLSSLITTYGNGITCVCFMGGDGSPEEILHLAKCVKRFHKKTAWYSGSSTIFNQVPQYFDYIKLGQYNEELGGLTKPTTNQRFYSVENTKMIDITAHFNKQFNNPLPK